MAKNSSISLFNGPVVKNHCYRRRVTTVQNTTYIWQELFTHKITKLIVLTGSCSYIHLH